MKKNLLFITLLLALILSLALTEQIIEKKKNKKLRSLEETEVLPN